MAAEAKSLRTSLWFLWVTLPLCRFLAWFLLKLFGRLKVEGKSNIPRQGPLLIFANHLSDLDPAVVQAACPRHIHFMAKAELFQIPVLRTFIRLFRAFPVSRGEPDRQALQCAIDLLRSGSAVCVFPEGEISESTHLLPLKAGAALIARQSKATLICVGIQGSQRVMPYGKLIPRPTTARVWLKWGEPHQFPEGATKEQIMHWARLQLLALTPDTNPAKATAEAGC